MRSLWLSVVLVASLSACGTPPGPPDGGGRLQDGGAPDAGAVPADAGRGGLDGGPGRIDHLVIVVLENHTFDNMFAKFPGAESRSRFAGPDGGGGFDAPVAPDSLPRDICHAHSCALTSWNGGAMDGWWGVANANQNNDHLAWAQYRRQDIPGFWQYAENYALADHFHSSMLGPSFPGHTFLLAAQAAWTQDNPSQLIPWGCDDGASTTIPAENPITCAQDKPFPCFNIQSAPDLLSGSQSWKFYGSVYFTSVWSMFDAIAPIRNGPGWSNVVPYTQFDSDIANGTLPTVSWLVDQDTQSGHPPFSMCSSENWVAGHVNKLIRSPYWATTAVIVTWDDYGGFQDHVAPPTYGCDPTHPYGQGFRLPAIIVSPWVKKGIFHGQTEQASVVRLIEELFGGPNAVGQLHRADSAARDDVAGSLLPVFDFNQAPLPPVTAQETCP